MFRVHKSESKKNVKHNKTKNSLKYKKKSTQIIIAFKTKQEKNPKVNNLKKKKKDTSVLKFNMCITDILRPEESIDFIARPSSSISS